MTIIYGLVNSLKGAGIYYSLNTSVENVINVLVSFYTTNEVFGHYSTTNVNVLFISSLVYGVLFWKKWIERHSIQYSLIFRFWYFQYLAAY